MNFLKENWPRLGTVFALIITPILFYYKSAIGLPLFLIWLQTPVYLLHQAEISNPWGIYRAFQSGYHW